MNKQKSKRKKGRASFLRLSILLVFCILVLIVGAVSRKISRKMSESAIQNVSESLDLIQCTIEAILRSETEFQSLIAKEIARAEDPEQYISTYGKNKMMARLSLIMTGETSGVSSNGEPFTEEGLDFSAGGCIEGLPVSKSYVNYMGAWSYTIKCPIERDGQEIGMLYAEYIYDAIDKSLPNEFYNKEATLYIMDAASERFVLKPKGMGQRDAGHLNLDDFYRANSIQDEEIKREVTECLNTGNNLLFYHDIRKEDALNYMWSVNDGTIFLVGYVPVEAIQREGKTVNQNIFIVVVSMLVAFFLCVVLYYMNSRQQERVRREREEERKIHNRQLSEALRAAQIASESKTMFLSNMSHDIRTPMNAVLGFTTLLAKDAENPGKVREYTKKIMASGQHLLSLINDILDVSKIESGKVVLNYEKFALNDVVSSVEAIIQPMAKAKGQEFNLEVTGIRHENLVGDETRINQILINLLSNAVKYTPECGHIWLRIIGLGQYSSQYERIRIEVEDDGYGMTQEYLKTIFDAFTRAENSTTNKVQGTGLGMAITKSIVELMGGTIEVSSEVDKGTIFVVSLELRIPQEQADWQFLKERGITHILLVGADEECIKNVRALIQGDIGLTTVDDTLKAITLIKEDKEGCPLVLTDWEACGLSAVREIREEFNKMPILLLAKYEAEGTEEALLLGHMAVLTKPFFVSALKESVVGLWAQPDSSKKEEAPREVSGFKGLRFLAAEDNEINAEILGELLEIEGAYCEIVENGKLAVERFEQSEKGEFDAVLMDVQMPVMNGHEAARAIRSLRREDAGSIPIIAMTANAFAEDERAALDAGMNAHVPKPLDMEVLKKVVRQYIGREES